MRFYYFRKVISFYYICWHLNYCIKQGINAAAQPITSYDCNQYTTDEKEGCPRNQGGNTQQQVLET